MPVLSPAGRSGAKLAGADGRTAGWGSITITAPVIDRFRDGLSRAATVNLVDVVWYGAGFAALGAGVIHLSATPAHSEHTPILAFFLVAGLLQVAWGALVMSTRPRTWVLEAGAWASVVLIATWITSRAWGLPLIAGAEHREPIGAKDTASALLEVLVVFGTAVLIGWKRSGAPQLRVSRRALAPLAGAAALVITTGLIAPSHVHSPISENHLATAVGHATPERHAATETHAPGHARQAVGMTGHTADAGAAHAPDHAAAARRDRPSPSVAAPAATPAEEIEELRTTVRYGPLLIPPASLGGTSRYNRILNNIEKPCSDCYIVRAKPDLVYRDGTHANLDSGPMLHHAVWTRPAVPDSTCSRDSAIGSQGMRFFASGNERTPLHLPDGFGYKVGSDQWRLIVEVMNHSEQTKTVYVKLDVAYRLATDDVKNVAPVWLDVNNCSNSEYSVPAGPSHQIWNWKSTVTGRVVAAGGHVHDGGIKTMLRNESSKDEMCTSVAGYGKDSRFAGSIESMSFCSWDRLGTVRTGETLGLHAYYDSSEAQDDVMGIILAYVFETRDLAGGSRAPANAPKEQDPPPVHEH